MQILALALSLLAVAASACDVPSEPVLTRNITEGFGIRVQNPEFPIVHNRFLNLWEAGGGDKHLYLSPAGEPSFDLTLTKGVLASDSIFAVINGEVSPRLAPWSTTD